MVETATPDTFAEVRVRFTKPDTTPYFSRGSDPIMALVLGELNVPMPTPDSIIPVITSHAGEPISRVDRMNMAAVEDAMPSAAGHRVPNRSESRPLTGPNIAIPAAPGASSSAANRASYSSPCIR